MKTKILLADDHTILREGMKTLFETETDMVVAGEASSGTDAVKKAKTLKPNLILMDINMPDINGMEATRLIVEQWPEISVIGLSVYYEKQFISGILKAGASGYLTKTSTFGEIVGAVKRVMQGCFAFDRQAQKVVFEDYLRLLMAAQSVKDPLSEQERKIINLCIAGTSLETAAEKLGIEQDEADALYSEIVRKWLSMI
jgi:two-component system response regulator NreC